MLLPYEEVKDLVPGLRLSPLGVVPRRETRPGLLSITAFTASMEEPQAGAADYQVHPDRGPDLPPAPVSRSHRGNLSKRPLAYVDVFVDDFLGLVKITRATLLRTSAVS